MSAPRGLLPCQYYDPQRGPFDPTPRTPSTMRHGKTRRDHETGAWAQRLKNRTARAEENRRLAGIK